MPRAVQVNSSSNLNLNTRGNDTAENIGVLFEDSEDDVNRNYNQKESESVTTLRFNINYGLYNVTYSPNEDEIYCLKCNVGGQELKFKKDARVWLHKSNDLKRKFEEKENEADKSTNESKDGDGADVEETKESFENITDEDEEQGRKLERIQQYFHNIFTGEYGNYRLTQEADSDLSSLGDSEADLTYSEETSPSESLLTSPNKTGTKGTASERAEIDENADQSDSSLTSEDKLIGSGITDLINDDEEEELINASGNNNQMKLARYEIARKLAPAIEMENDSLNETLLDSAVNAFSSDCVAANTRHRAKISGQPISLSTSTSSTRPWKRSGRQTRYNLRGRTLADRIICQSKHREKCKMKQRKIQLTGNAQNREKCNTALNEIANLKPGQTHNIAMTLHPLVSLNNQSGTSNKDQNLPKTDRSESTKLPFDSSSDKDITD